MNNGEVVTGGKTSLLSRRRMSRSARPGTPRRGVANGTQAARLVTSRRTVRQVRDSHCQRYARSLSRPSSLPLQGVTVELDSSTSKTDGVVVNVSGTRFSVGKLFFCLFGWLF